MTCYQIKGVGRVVAIGAGKYIGTVECTDGMRIETPELCSPAAAVMSTQTICRQLCISLDLVEAARTLPGLVDAAAEDHLRRKRDRASDDHRRRRGAARTLPRWVSPGEGET